MSEVLSLMETVSGTATKNNLAYDYQTFSQVPLERFQKLKEAFIVFDKDKSGQIKTSGKKVLAIPRECGSNPRILNLDLGSFNN